VLWQGQETYAAELRAMVGAGTRQVGYQLDVRDRLQ